MAAKAIPQSSIPPLTPDEEDELIILRLANDEKILRRLAKRFRSIQALSKNDDQMPIEGGKSQEELLQEAREAFLTDLELFQLMLLKNRQVCEAEARMVQQYDAEKERIGKEQQALENDIVRLKAELAEAQLTRQRRMEYDAIAEQINALPTRSELEATVARHEEEVMVAVAERGKQRAELLARKSEFDSVVSSLNDIRTRGLIRDDAARMNEGDEPGEVDETGQDAAMSKTHPSLNPLAKPFQPIHSLLPSVPSRPGTPVSAPTATGNILAVPSPRAQGSRSAVSSPAPPSRTLEKLEDAPPLPVDDDIEMGEVAEEPVEEKAPAPKAPPREELEEGEASDESSELSDPPDSD